MNTDSDGVIEKPAVWGLPGTIIWGIIIICVLIISQVVAIGVYTVVNHPDAGTVDTELLMNRYLYHGQAIAYGLITSLAVCLPLVLGIVKLKKNTSLGSYLGFRPVPLRILGYWVLIYLGFSIVYDLVGYFLGSRIVPEFSLAIYETGRGSLLFWFAVLVAAPFLEEVIFRGFLFRGIEASILGPVGAVLLTSLVWTAIHMQYSLFWQANIFVLGILFGLARYKTGSTLVTFQLHFLHNLLAMAITAGVAEAW